jgi:hypothetical protein
MTVIDPIERRKLDNHVPATSSNAHAPPQYLTTLGLISMVKSFRSATNAASI